jgi:hypothetical protein
VAQLSIAVIDGVRAFFLIPSSMARLRLRAAGRQLKWLIEIALGSGKLPL